jgi:hypothetical protein
MFGIHDSRQMDTHLRRALDVIVAAISTKGDIRVIRWHHMVALEIASSSSHSALPNSTLPSSLRITESERPVEIVPALRSLQQTFCLEPFEAGRVPQLGEAKNLQESLRRHISERRAWFGRAVDSVVGPPVVHFYEALPTTAASPNVPLHLATGNDRCPCSRRKARRALRPIFRRSGLSVAHRYL